MNQPGLDQVIQALGEVPSLSKVVSQLLLLFRDPHASISDVKRVAAHDPQLSQRIVLLAKQVALRAGREVPDFKMAVNFLGFKNLKSMIIMTGVMDAIPKKQGAVRFEEWRFWQHSYAAGLMYRQMAQDEGLDLDMSFLCGLLHDIGKILINICLPKEMEQLLVMSQRTGVSLKAVEGLVLTTTHGEVGGWLARQWGLPPDVADFIEHHHRHDPEVGDSLDAISNVVDWILYERGLQSPGTFGEPVVAPSLWDKVTLKPAGVRKFLREMKTDLSSLDVLIPPEM